MESEERKQNNGLWPTCPKCHEGGMMLFFVDKVDGLW